MKILIVDDEEPARIRLRSLLAEILGYTVCGEACNGTEALKLAQLTYPDIVLMDIRMPDMDGIEAAYHLNAMEEPPAIIFTTAYSEHALEAFNVNAVDYLVKPIRRELLERALTKARVLNRAQLTALRIHDPKRCRTHIRTRLGDKIELIPIDQVIYFLADQKYVTVRHIKGEVLTEESLKSLENEFGEAFLRIHRNALVAKTYLNGLEKTADGHFQITLRESDEKIKVSRRHLAGVREYMKQG